MGSFNETCALSNLNIGYGTPVRLLFLTRNPYVSSDQREDQRGCYHYDQWFVRTPPIKGEYADYGRCAFDESPITELICKCFQKDVVERPFGFNQYHTGDVTKTKGIHHFLQAAWQGRLLVKDGGDIPPSQGCLPKHHTSKKLPPEFPTWQRVHAILKAAKLPIQLESKISEGQAGYNAQPVMRGVVCVTFNSYGDHTKHFEKAIKVLDKHYDCKVVYQIPERKYEGCIMVTVKGGFDNTALLHNDSFVQNMLNRHPEHRNEPRQLPVLAVMVREDVWQAYSNVVGDRIPTVKSIVARLKKTPAKRGIPELDDIIAETDFRDTFVSLPFQITVGTHVIAVKNGNFPAEFQDELLNGCAELARIEIVMAHLHQPWYIPPLGGQEGAWALRTKVLSKILDISKKELKAVDE